MIRNKIINFSQKKEKEKRKDNCEIKTIISKRRPKIYEV